MNIDNELDARGLNCPLPILKAKKVLTKMLSGQLLKVKFARQPELWITRRLAVQPIHRAS